MDAAIRLADEVGPDRLTTEAVARAVGITQPAIFRHFPKKQNLWEAVATRISGRMRKQWSGVLGAGMPADERLRRLITTQLQFIRSNPAIPAILFSRELHSGSETLRKAFYGLMSKLHGVIAGIVEAGIAEGTFRDDLDSRDAAFVLLGFVQGLAVRWSLSGKSFDIVDEGGRLLEVQLAALAARRGGDERERTA